MYKVGLSVVVSLFFSTLIYALFMNTHEYIGVFVRLSILVALGVGLYSAYRLNLNHIHTYFKKKNKLNHQRVKAKTLTLNLIWLFSVLFAYVMYSHLQQTLYFAYCLDALIFSPFILLAIYAWVVFLDQRQLEPNDVYATIWVDLKNRRFTWQAYKLFILSSIVKIFYIPFVYGAACIAIEQLLLLENILAEPSQWVKFLFLFGICFDVTIAIGGYVFSSKFFATDTLSVDETWQGWLVCLICYPPFVIIFKFFTQQIDSYIWSDWLTPDSILYWIWATLICLTWICYWAATVSFGFRFSNLSWRGLVNTGLYRYSKHPAYISKNIYWWLHTVPFFGVVGLDLWRNILALTAVSLTYYLRAKTEERHLMKFAEYREYQHWISKHGLWAKIKKNK